MRTRKKAIVLLSGGMDSATTAAIACKQGYDVHALSFSYGQRQHVELERARLVASALGISDHRVQNIDLRLFGGSALTSDIPVPKERSENEIGNGIPVTYVPARNTVFLSFALAFAESIAAFDLFIGVNAVDYSGYPDCRPEYIEAFERMANLATAAGVEGKGTFTIHTPLIALTKAEIVKKGMELGVDYANTLSCYDPVNGKACGRCDACQLRLKGFREAGVSDPAPYAA
ncbi:MAG: 7-cyano-7-deazaguanine synthase QueC [Proteobacteria bacterium]|nr:7-cyano-7-deazaguanine synthase QueC [Pseudomonadota bacterium]